MLNSLLAQYIPAILTILDLFHDLFSHHSGLSFLELCHYDTDVLILFPLLFGSFDFLFVVSCYLEDYRCYQNITQLRLGLVFVMCHLDQMV